MPACAASLRNLVRNAGWKYRQLSSFVEMGTTAIDANAQESYV